MALNWIHTQMASDTRNLRTLIGTFESVNCLAVGKSRFCVCGKFLAIFFKLRRRHLQNYYLFKSDFHSGMRILFVADEVFAHENVET